MTGFHSQVTHNEKGERLYRIQMETADKRCYEDVQAVIRKYIKGKQKMRGQKNDYTVRDSKAI